MSPRTFFRHFPTKLDALLGDVSTRTYDFAVTLHRQPLDLSLLDALERAIAESSTTDPAQQRVDLTRAWILLTTDSLSGVVRHTDEALEGYLAEWVAQRTRRHRHDFDVRVMASLLVAARRVVVADWITSGGMADVTQLARRSLAQLHDVPSAITSHQTEPGENGDETHGAQSGKRNPPDIAARSPRRVRGAAGEARPATGRAQNPGIRPTRWT